MQKLVTLSDADHGGVFEIYGKSGSIGGPLVDGPLNEENLFQAIDWKSQNQK